MLVVRALRVWDSSIGDVSSCGVLREFDKYVGCVLRSGLEELFLWWIFPVIPTVLYSDHIYLIPFCHKLVILFDQKFDGKQCIIDSSILLWSWCRTCVFFSHSPKVKEIHICGCRWYERLKGKTDGSTLLTYTGLHGELEHLKIETRLIGESFECVIHMILSCQIHYSQMVTQEQTRGLGFGCAINQRTWVHVWARSVDMGRVGIRMFFECFYCHLKKLIVVRAPRLYNLPSKNYSAVRYTVTKWSLNRQKAWV